MARWPTHAYAFDIAFGVYEFCVCAIPTFRRLQRGQKFHGSC
jgi:hypothetical protein